VVGFVALVAGELTTGLSFWGQLGSGGLGTAILVSVAVTAASFAPGLRQVRHSMNVAASTDTDTAACAPSATHTSWRATSVFTAHSHCSPPSARAPCPSVNCTSLHALRASLTPSRRLACPFCLHHVTPKTPHPHCTAHAPCRVPARVPAGRESTATPTPSHAAMHLPTNLLVHDLCSRYAWRLHQRLLKGPRNSWLVPTTPAVPAAGAMAEGFRQGRRPRVLRAIQPSDGARQREGRDAGHRRHVSHGGPRQLPRLLLASCVGRAQRPTGLTE
jgi:hypothetical protein